ncbi:hypothetical protein TPHA_0A05130 [Tetrapisispora phaffii CBS 4417]|uniref:MICOS complex subunit n=1 Tax=Tetrapisispora phaffii (strain ATCC 24235 / CBS 4417 / NBRC 1672 / NRRL Y-8282 / UCD 70-5) TaxID=1071381 RepID=G8BNW0_TETPH|nr:hypothetical protein TPHA_0A05130 [Tetrapisispora phaffii CBS 4417]CCE61588.1 hypothetical protein TPHA_0A05130 [Tetrapisispora phaffii CBS 4417]
MTFDYYRKVDLIKEYVVAQGESISTPIDLINTSKDSNTASKLTGPTRIIDGVSVRCPSYLLRFCNKLNNNAALQYHTLNSKLEHATNRYYKAENKVTSRIANLHSDPEEQLSKGFAYSIVAAMSGSILTKRRNILLRFTMPIILGTLVCSYTIPTTFENTTDLIHDIEEVYFPKFCAKQDRVMDFIRTGIAHTVMSYDIVSYKLASAKDYIQQHSNFS